jgi:aryl-alcohol dehydrogenase
VRISAAVSYGADSSVVIQDVEIEPPSNDEVLVRLVASGICHTDLVAKRLFRPGLPVVLGHEGAGVVEAVGDGVHGVAVGDHVLLSFQSCGSCESCLADVPAYCGQFGALNMTGFRPDGSSPLSRGGERVAGAFFGQSSFATHALVTPRNLVVVDQAVDLVTCSPFGCGMQTGAGAVVNVLRPDATSKLVVFGAGGVGMAAIMAARATGVETVIAVDVNPTRLKTAEELGATAVVDGSSSDLRNRLRALTGGGATHAIDTTSSETVIKHAVDGLASQGELVLLGTGAAELQIDAMSLIRGGKSIRGSIEGDADPQRFMPKLLAWHREGKFPVEQIIRPYPFSKIADAFADLDSGDVIKPVLVFE